jgi:hypothetical protein
VVDWWVRRRAGTLEELSTGAGLDKVATRAVRERIGLPIGVNLVHNGGLTLLGIAMIVSGRMTGEPPTGRSSAGRGPAQVSVPCCWAAARRS